MKIAGIEVGLWQRIRMLVSGWVEEALFNRRFEARVRGIENAILELKLWRLKINHKIGFADTVPMPPRHPRPARRAVRQSGERPQGWADHGDG